MYIRAVLHIKELSTGQGRLEQCVPQSKMERTSSNPTLPTMALGRCRSKPKQSSAGGLDMHARLCSRSTQCGTVWPRLVHGRGEPIARARAKGGATTPHCDGACGFLKFWSLNLTGNCSGGACSSPGQSRLLSVGSLSGYLNMTGHEEPPAQLSRGVMPLFPSRRSSGAWPDLSWPDSRPSSLVPAPAPSSSSGSRKSLRGSRQRLGHQQEPIILGGRGVSRSDKTASRPAGLHPGSPSQS